MIQMWQEERQWKWREDDWFYRLLPSGPECPKAGDAPQLGTSSSWKELDTEQNPLFFLSQYLSSVITFLSLLVASTLVSIAALGV